VDRAALDAALGAAIPCGGWCPAGRWAEDGPIPDRYPLRETTSSEPAERTRLNVRDSDGTLVLGAAPLRGGTALAAAHARALGRPLLVLDPTAPGAVDEALTWLRAHRIGTLNVAGPRESEAPGVYAATLRFMEALLGSPLAQSSARRWRPA
jgi:hypothetical protein